MRAQCWTLGLSLINSLEQSVTSFHSMFALACYYNAHKHLQPWLLTRDSYCSGMQQNDTWLCVLGAYTCTRSRDYVHNCASEVVGYMQLLRNCASEVVGYMQLLHNCASEVVGYMQLLCNCASEVVGYTQLLRNCASEVVGCRQLSVMVFSFVWCCCPQVWPWACIHTPLDQGPYPR